MATTTFTSNFMVSLQNGSRLENQIRQGFMAGDGGSGDNCRYAGLWGFDYSAINTTLNGMIIDAVTLTMTSSSWGVSNSYSLNIYKAPYQAGTQNSLLIPNDYYPQSEIYNLTSYITSPLFARNQTNTFSISADYLQHIRDGYLLACYRRTSVATPTDSHYTRAFDIAPVLTVTYHAPVSTFTLSASSLDAGQTITVSISPSDANYRHTVTFAFGSASQQYTGVETSQGFTIPLAWINQIPNSTSGTASCTVQTYSGSTLMGTAPAQYFNITVPASVKPTLTSLTATLVDGYWNLYVQGKSRVTLTANGAGGTYGSTITGYSIASGSTNPFTTGVLNNAGTNSFTATVTDSRGRTSDAVSCSITVTAYATPAISGV